MKVSEKGKEIIMKHEGVRLKAYLCPAKIPTIGWGNTTYENGTKVKIGDEITLERAKSLFNLIISRFEKSVLTALKGTKVNQNQFDAIVSFTYNVGAGNLNKSTLLKKVIANPNDLTIRDEFMKWNKAGGKVLNGLTKRREEEANIYFS
jgi:lysozyme